MKFEWLPNELILEVFEYFDGVNILRTFYGLNSRINKLLNSSFQSYHLNFRSISKHNFNIVCQEHLPFIIDKVISLDLSDDDETPNLPELFLSHGFSINRFIHLKSLSLCSIRSLDILKHIIFQCHHLTHLSLITCLFTDEESQLINCIWGLLKLTHCNIDDSMLKRTYFSKLSTVSSSIKYLTIKNITCDLDNLSHLFQQTLSLQQLSTTILCIEQNFKLQTTLPLMTSLTLSFDGTLVKMINILQTMSNLRYLTLSTSGLFLNGDDWKTLLIEYLPKLKVFRLKMNIQFPQKYPIENSIDELLVTYQTDFWIKLHRWFVRCDWNPLDPFNHALLYTLPYAFKEFQFINESCSKSTCPNEKDYWSYNHVELIQHENNLSNHSTYFRLRFPNIRHLEIILPFNETFFTIIPSLEHLYSLDVTLLPGDSAYYQLQMLLNRASRLYLLRFSHLSDLEMILFKLTSSSIRRLDFFTKESMLYSWYFNKEQCITLANSLLGQQCQHLVIDIKNRTDILELIHSMNKLQSLTFQCKDDKWNNKKALSTNDELLQWLHEHLPSTCSFVRHTHQSSIIQLWIR